MKIDVFVLCNDDRLVTQTIANIEEYFNVSPKTLYGANSIAEGYNKLADNSTADIFCFIHQDARIRFTSDVLIKYFEELDNPGILGFCGSGDMVCGKQWHECQPTYGALIQGETNQQRISFNEVTQTTGCLRYQQVHTLDGYCLFMLRSTYDKIRGFDEDYKAWHGYDIDICAKAISCGFKNYVIDQPSQHYSWGSGGHDLTAALMRFKEKWENMGFETTSYRVADRLPKGKLKIYVYTICRDELQFCERFAKSCEDADGVYVLDTGSVDGTPKALEKLGVNVDIVHFDKWKTLEEYDKLVAEDKNPWRFDISRNMSIDMVPQDADVLVCIDLDEILVPGWRKLIEDAWVNGVNHLSYFFAWSMVDNKPKHCFWYEKIHNRNGYIWASPVHEAIVPVYGTTDVRGVINQVVVQHYPDSSKSRAQYLPLLELGVRESPSDSRIRFYLGREYTFAGRYQDAINSHIYYLSMVNSTCVRERANACLQIASCYGKLKESAHENKPMSVDYENKQFSWLIRAISEQSTQRETWLELADFCRIKGDNLFGYIAAKKALDIPIEDCDNNYLVDPDAWGYKPHDLASVMGWYAGDVQYKEESLQNAWKALKHAPYDSRLEGNYKLIQDILKKESTTAAISVDVVILSCSKNEKIYNMTKQSIHSLRISSPNVGMRFVVVETNENLANELFVKNDENLFGKNVDVCYPGVEFGFNAYLKFGVDHFREMNSNSKYIVLMNNDVVLFNQNFMQHMVDGMKHVVSASPLGLREATWGLINQSIPIDENYDVNRAMVGWFIMFDTRILNSKPFEEYFPPRFDWYGGDVYYGQVLERLGYKHGLINAAQALHLQQQSKDIKSGACSDRSEMLVQLCLNGKRCAEIGVERGNFAQEILNQNPSSLLLVDPWKHQDESIYQDPSNVDDVEFERRYQEVQNKFGNDKRVTLCVSESVQASELTQPESLDFVYIDAIHTEPAVYEDMCCWWPKVKSGGWLCGHDFQFQGVSGAVYRFCKDNNVKLCFITQEYVSSWAIKKP
tara:strand:+ start:2800 stop:5868 length:3069 start_codon:yes stop_codon:yes gene_type:complete